MSSCSTSLGEAQVLPAVRPHEVHVEPRAARAQPGDPGPLAEMLAGLVAFAAAFGYGYRG